MGVVSMSRVFFNYLLRSLAVSGRSASRLPAMAEVSGDQVAAPSASPLTTVHLYYNDTYLFRNTAKVLAVSETEMDEKKQISVVLDQTVMHPQGGE